MLLRSSKLRAAVKVVISEQTVILYLARRAISMPSPLRIFKCSDFCKCKKNGKIELERNTID